MALISNRWSQSLGESEGSVDSIPAIQSAPPNPSSIPRSLNVSVIAPGLLSWQGSAQSVTLPSPSGEFEILTGHASLTTFLDVGSLRIRMKDDQVLGLVMLGGFVKVEGDEVTILAAGAERVDGLELRKTFAAVETAEADLNQTQNSSARWEAKKKSETSLRSMASCFLPLISNSKFGTILPHFSDRSDYQELLIPLGVRVPEPMNFEFGIACWMEDHEYESVQQMQGVV